LALVFVALALSVALTFVRDKPGETAVYRMAAERFLRGEEFYVPSDASAFTYPPFFVLPYVPLVCLPENVARGVWYFMNFCLLGVIVRLTVGMVSPIIREYTFAECEIVAGTRRVPSAERVTEAPNGTRRVPATLHTANGCVREDARFGKRRAMVAACLVGVMSIRFLISPIEYQSHDLVVYWLVMLAMLAWARSAGGRAGAWAGLAAACKATPLLFLPAFLWQGRFRAGALLCVVLVAATVLPDLVSPCPDAPLWVVSWYEKFISKVDAASAPEAQGAWAGWSYMNQSLSGTLHRLATPIDQPTEDRWNVCLYPLAPHQLARLALGLKLAVVGWILAITWPGRLRRMGPSERTFSTLGQGAAILCAMLLLSPMTSKQHFCVLLAPVSFCVTDFLYRRRDPVVGFALATMFVLGALAGRDVIGLTLHRQLAAYGSLTWCTLALLVACGHVVLARARAGRLTHTPT
jgi:hypothetical protein